MIASKAYGTLICGGDLNIHLQPKLDLSNTKSIREATSQASMVQKLLKELGLIDVWRGLNPKDKQ